MIPRQAGNGPAVDGCNVEDMGRVYAEDGIYDVRDFRYMDGLAEIRGKGHRSLTGNGAAHIGTLPHVELDGRQSSRDLAARVFEGPDQDSGARSDSYSLGSNPE